MVTDPPLQLFVPLSKQRTDVVRMLVRLRAYYGANVRTGVVQVRAYEFTDMGILLFCYRRTNLHTSTYARMSAVHFLYIEYILPLITPQLTKPHTSPHLLVAPPLPTPLPSPLLSNHPSLPPPPHPCRLTHW